MSVESVIKPTYHQRGLALLMLVFILALMAIGFAVRSLDSAAIQNKQDKKTAAALAEAKAALIGYAIIYDDEHSDQLFGYLPCPDESPTDHPSNEGSESHCGASGVSVLGRFPWKNLQIEPTKDGNGECLWYAVSGGYKSNTKIAGITPNTLGALNVFAADGINYLAGPADPAVAVVFSAGPPLSGQDRVEGVDAVVCGGNYDVDNYLDTDIVSNISNTTISADVGGNSTFIAATNSKFTINDQDKFNDKLIIITRNDIFASYCKKYANSLLSYISASNSNDCDDGRTPKAPVDACAIASDNLQNCDSTCGVAAQTFASTTCLTDLTNPGCSEAISDLGVCHA